MPHSERRIRRLIHDQNQRADVSLENIISKITAQGAKRLARAAIEVLMELAQAKTPTGSPSLLRERASVQSDIARAEALVRAARALVFEVAEELWETIGQTGETPMRLRASVRLACAHAAVSSVQAVDLMYTAGGATSLREENRLERLFRDVHAAAQHLAVIPHNFEVAGRESVLEFIVPGSVCRGQIP